MSVDLRTRFDGITDAGGADELFGEVLPQRLADSAERIAAGLARLEAPAMVLEWPGASWTLRRLGDGADSRVGLERGVTDPQACRVRFTREQIEALLSDQATPITFYTAGALEMSRDRLGDLLDWWLVLRAVLDDRDLYTPGSIDFRAADGAPLDLYRSFDPDEDVAVMSHFLHEAGYLHIRGLFESSLMEEVSADIDRSIGEYSDGDGRSWWATTRGGERRAVRLQSFDRHSSAAASILGDPRFLRIGDLPGDDHVHTGLEGNLIEALIKPIGVVEGISDLPWHKDCSLGRHSYECCSMTVGISVTGADATSGQLRVRAGSHRALVWPAIVPPGKYDLPDVELPTQAGDVTVHLSCLLHMSQPPVERERRVMYTSFRLPPRDAAAAARARASLRAVREGAHRVVSQPPARGDANRRGSS